MVMTLERLYDNCLTLGKITEEEDGGLGKELLDSSEERLSSMKKGNRPSGQDHTAQFQERFTILRDLAKGIVSSEGTRTADDQALFACLCVRHPEYAPDWEELEGMRLLSEAVVEGKIVTAERWALLKLKMELTTQALLADLRKMMV